MPISNRKPSPHERRKKFQKKDKGEQEALLEPAAASSHDSETFKGFDSFSLVVVIWQVIMMGLFFGFASYPTGLPEKAESLLLYSYYRDVAVM
jgi:hypothetical protein